MMTKQLCSVGMTALGTLVLASCSLFGGGLSEGTEVFGEWQNNAWYHGRIGPSCDGGQVVLFDDGDKKCCTKEQIVLDLPPAANKIKAGAKVLALWSNGKYYPGVVAAEEGGKFKIDFSDGDKGKVEAAHIRLR